MSSTTHLPKLALCPHAAPSLVFCSPVLFHLAAVVIKCPSFNHILLTSRIYCTMKINESNADDACVCLLNDHTSCVSCVSLLVN